MDRWVVAGLTNPEAEYGGTRHNIGADVVRALAARLGSTLKPHKVQALVADTWDVPGGTPISLAVPYGYMNNSGGPVQQLASFYSIAHDRLIVVADELDLDPGTVRVKQGGTGGHNGLKDVKRRLGDPGEGQYLRVRVGIGRPPGQKPVTAYVLGKFNKADRSVMDVAVERAGDVVLSLIQNGVATTQQRYH